MNTAEITDKLGSHSLHGDIPATCAVSGAGLHEGLDWLPTSSKPRSDWKQFSPHALWWSQLASSVCVCVCAWGAKCACVAGGGGSFLTPCLIHAIETQPYILQKTSVTFNTASDVDSFDDHSYSWWRNPQGFLGAWQPEWSSQWKSRELAWGPSSIVQPWIWCLQTGGPVRLQCLREGRNCHSFPSLPELAAHFSVL